MPMDDPFRLPNFIDLDLGTRIGGGQYYNVYEFPDLPGVLVKTVRADLADENGFHRKANPIRRRRLLGIYGAMARELNEFLIQLRRRRGLLGKLPFARPYGFVQTREGLGLVVEKIADRTGRIAPTLRDLCRSGRFEPFHLTALNTLLDRCKREHVVLGDVNGQNIVFTDGRDGEPEFVVIDGLGEKAAIPIHSVSRYFNGRRVERLRQRMLADIQKWSRQALGHSLAAAATITPTRRVEKPETVKRG